MSKLMYKVGASMQSEIAHLNERIAAADAMAKALETLMDHGEPLRGNGELWSSWQIRVKDRTNARTALAAYNALR